MLRILIADDEEIERKYLAALFVKHSDTYKVVGEACNGREVLELTAKNSPDIIIMDINMPGLDGLTSAQRIKQRFPDTIIFHEKMGVTITEYITKKRIEKAEYLLIYTEASIQEIASRCGFSSTAHFHRIFKQKTDTTPLEYRHKHT